MLINAYAVIAIRGSQDESHIDYNQFTDNTIENDLIPVTVEEIECKNQQENTINNQQKDSMVKREVKMENEMEAPETIVKVRRYGRMMIDSEAQCNNILYERRLRNRMAARKCRQKKLAEIQRLETLKKGLNEELRELKTHAMLFRRQVRDLAKRLMQHRINGCKMNQHVKN